MPKKAGGNSTKDLVKRIQAASDIRTLVDLVRDAPKELGTSALHVMLNALCTKSVDPPAGEDLSEEVLELGESLLKAAVVANQGRPPEPAVTVMARICCGFGKPQRAFALVAEAEAAGTKPKLRTLSTILSQAADAEDVETCTSLWSRLPAMDLEPQDREWTAMLRGLRSSPIRQREVLKQMVEDLPLPSDPPLIEEIAQVFGVSSIAHLREASQSSQKGFEDDGSRWHVGWTSVDAEGFCSLSGKRLQALGLSTKEEETLFAYITRLANDHKENKGFRKFQRWIRERGPYDVIIDGANVGFNNQNKIGGCFQYDQIEAVVDHYRNLKQRVLLVLHPKWLKENPDLTLTHRKRRKLDPISKESLAEFQEIGEGEISDDDRSDLVFPHSGITQAEMDAELGTPLAFIRGWKEEEILLAVPAYDNDDWYWLYAALDSFRRGKRSVQVITNDQMRDHHWRMEGCRGFSQWQDRHVTRMNIHPGDSDQGDEVILDLQLYPPKPYSLRAQVSEDGQAWHFPVLAIRSRAEQISSGRPVGTKEIETAGHHWLVAWKTTE